jgi:hypothetical protein
MAKVNKDGPIPAHMPHLGQCWEWTGALSADGYGLAVVSIKPTRMAGAHRVSFEQFVGPIPDDKPQVLHRCDNRRCVRPSHLFAGTHQDNMDDMMSKGRSSAGKPRGGKVDAEEAIRLRQLGWTYKQIGDRFGVSQSMAHRAVTDAAGRLMPKTHCGKGHEFTPENTYRNKKGHRSCRACALAKEAKRGKRSR